MMKKYICLLIGLLFCCHSYGQASDASVKPFSRLSWGVSLGTTGVGVDVAAPIASFVDIRAGFDFFPSFNLSTSFATNALNAESFTHDIDMPENIDFNVRPYLSTGHLVFDFYPIKSADFKIVAGVYFGNSNVGEAISASAEEEMKSVYEYNQEKREEARKEHWTESQLQRALIGVNMGDYLLEPNREGRIVASYRTNVVQPYLGIGYGRSVKQDGKLGWNVELGARVWGKPTVLCNAVEVVDDTWDKSGSSLWRTVARAQIYPTLTVRLTGKIF
ncbi:MAG: hypothetical protein MJZ36_00325 [Bacteroidaceae bacterium]|nr:hypothetical protein [Bacteroidaceae bacterium]